MEMEQINKFDIISFDMFDTLISRPFASPKDLQEYAGGLQYRKDRQSGKIAKPTQRELDLELELCQPIPKIKKIFDEAQRLKKKVLVVSDMYLPSSFLKQILDKCGYTNYKLYVSCECGCGKGDNLFKKILNENIGTMIHFDDAQYAINRARELGITAIKVRKIIDDLFDRYPRLKFLKQDTIALKYYIGWLSQQPVHNNFYRQIGLLLGVVGYGFAQFVNKITKDFKIDSILFLSRDMFIIQKFYNRIGKITNHYVYSSRKLSTNNKDYSFYYDKFKKGRSCIVDSITGYYSVQKLIKADYQIYETIGNYESNPSVHTPQTWGTIKNRLRPHPFLEQLWTEPVGSVIDIDKDCKPVRRIEKERNIDFVRELTEGELEFKALPNILFSFDDCKEIYRNFVLGMTEQEKVEIEKLAFYCDVNHTIIREKFDHEEKGI